MQINLYFFSEKKKLIERVNQGCYELDSFMIFVFLIFFRMCTL